MRYLALDVGDERIGLALSDERGVLARPLETIRRVAGPASFQHIATLVAEQGVGEIVVGLPLLEGGGEGKQTASVHAYVRGLREHVAVPIVYWDERYSTRRAQEHMAESGRSRRHRRRQVDAVAAAVILQEYLDEQNSP